MHFDLIDQRIDARGHLVASNGVHERGTAVERHMHHVEVGASAHHDAEEMGQATGCRTAKIGLSRICLHPVDEIGHCFGRMCRIDGHAELERGNLGHRCKVGAGVVWQFAKNQGCQNRHHHRRQQQGAAIGSGILKGFGSNSTACAGFVFNNDGLFEIGGHALANKACRQIG